jgi:hypothetical protein
MAAWGGWHHPPRGRADAPWCRGMRGGK